MNEELDLKEIIKCSYQRKIILISIIIIPIVLGILYAFFIKKPIDQVTSQILIDKSEASIEQVVSSKELIQDEMEVEFDKTSKLIKITTEMENQEDALNNCQIKGDFLYEKRTNRKNKKHNFMGNINFLNTIFCNSMQYSNK